MENLLVILQQLWQSMSLIEQLCAIGTTWLGAAALCFTGIGIVRTTYNAVTGLASNIRAGMRRRREEQEASIVRKVLDAIGEPMPQLVNVNEATKERG